EGPCDAGPGSRRREWTPSDLSRNDQREASRANTLQNAEQLRLTRRRIDARNRPEQCLVILERAYPTRPTIWGVARLGGFLQSDCQFLSPVHFLPVTGEVDFGAVGRSP